MNFEESAKKLYTLPWQALYDLAVEKQIDGEEIKHKERLDMSKSAVRDKVSHAMSNDELDHPAPSTLFNDSVPSPSVALRKMTESGLLDYIVEIAGNCLNMAMETAQDTVAADTGKLFVPQNWIKSKTSLKDIRAAVKQMVASLKMLPDGKKVLARLNEGLAMNKEDFEARWTAD